MSSNIRIIPRLDIKGANLIKGIHLEGLRVIGNPNDFANKYYKESAKFTNTYYGQLSFNKIYSGQDFKLSPELKIVDNYEE